MGIVLHCTVVSRPRYRLFWSVYDQQRRLCRLRGTAYRYIETLYTPDLFLSRAESKHSCSTRLSLSRKIPFAIALAFPPVPKPSRSRPASTSGIFPCRSLTQAAQREDFAGYFYLFFSSSFDLWVAYVMVVEWRNSKENGLLESLNDVIVAVFWGGVVCLLCYQPSPVRN